MFILQQSLLQQKQCDYKVIFCEVSEAPLREKLC